MPSTKKGKKEQKEERPPATLNKAAWVSSEARKLIAQDIIDGHIPSFGEPFDTEEVFNRLYAGNAFFDDFPYDKERYKNRIVSLQTTIYTWGHWAKFDDEALMHDLALVGPPPERNIRGQLRWDGSAAQAQLKIDVDNKIDKQFETPKKFWKSNPVYYLHHDLTVFRKHIDQYKESVKEYGQTPGQAKARKKKMSKFKVGGKEYKRDTGSGSAVV